MKKNAIVEGNSKVNNDELLPGNANTSPTAIAATNATVPPTIPIPTPCINKQLYSSLYNREMEIMRNILRNGGSELCNQFPFINHTHRGTGIGAGAVGPMSDTGVRIDASLFSSAAEQHNYNHMASSNFGSFPVDTFNLGIPKTINTTLTTTTAEKAGNAAASVNAAVAAAAAAAAVAENTPTTNNQIESPHLIATNYRGMVGGAGSGGAGRNSVALTSLPHSISHHHQPHQNQQPLSSSSFSEKDNNNYCIRDSNLNEVDAAKMLYSPTKSIKTISNCDRVDVIETNNHQHHQQHTTPQFSSRHHQHQQQQQQQQHHHHQHHHHQNMLSPPLGLMSPSTASATAAASILMLGGGGVSGGGGCGGGGKVASPTSPTIPTTPAVGGATQGDIIYHKKIDEHLMSANKSINMSESEIIFYEKTNNSLLTQNNSERCGSRIGVRGGGVHPSSLSLSSSSSSSGTARAHDNARNAVMGCTGGGEGMEYGGNNVLTATLDGKRNENETDVDGEASGGMGDSDGENNFVIL